MARVVQSLNAAARLARRQDGGSRRSRDQPHAANVSLVTLFTMQAVMPEGPGWGVHIKADWLAGANRQVTPA